MKELTTTDTINIQFILLCNDLEKPCYVDKKYINKITKQHPHFPEIKIKGSLKDVGTWHLDKYESYGWNIVEIDNIHGGIRHPLTDNRQPTKEFWRSKD